MAPNAKRPDWASWSTRRLLVVAALYGLGMGCVLGVSQALIDGDDLTDGAETVGADILVWVLGAALILGITRWAARHPRRR